MKLTTKQAKPITKLTFPKYTGRKFKLVFAETVIFYDTNCSGGTVNKYAFVKSSGESYSLPVYSPFNNPVEGQRVEVPEDVLVVCHAHFCGQDMGITITANPTLAPKWIEA